jgi:hypothetical protein
MRVKSARSAVVRWTVFAYPAISFLPLLSRVEVAVVRGRFRQHLAEHGVNCC